MMYKKRIISVLLVIAMLLSMAFTVSAELEEKVNQSAEFASNGAALMGNIPLSGTFKNNQKYSMMLCTAGGYWLPASYESGVQSLTVNAGGTNTELVTFQTHYGVYSAWGVDAIWVDVIPTDAAAAITEDTPISGSLTVDAAGSQHFGEGTATVHFSFTLKPATITPNAALEDKVDESGEYASNNAVLGSYALGGSLDADQRLKLMLCTAGGYWLPTSYETGYTGLEINAGGSNTELVQFYTSCENYAPWGTNCIWINVEPTAAGRAITQDTVVSGNLAVEGYTVPFSFNLNAVIVVPDASLTEKVDESADYANGDALNGGIALGGSLEASQRLKLMLCTTYWLPDYVSGYHKLQINDGGTNTDLVRFYTSCESYDAWGTDCIWVNVEPTELGKAVTEDTPVTGSLSVEGYTVSFSFTLKAAGIIPDASLEDKVDESDAYAQNNAILGSYPLGGNLEANQRLKLMLCTATNEYWLPASYQAGYHELQINEGGTNTDLVRMYTSCEPYSTWGNCLWINVEPTAAGKAVTGATEVSGSFTMDATGSQCFGDGFATVNFSFVLEPVSIEATDAYLVGMAKADITPAEDVYLQGFGGPDESTLCKYPDDHTSNLLARVMVVDNGTDRLVFLNLEMIMSGWAYGSANVSEALISQIATICNTSTSNVLLSNTHTHQSYMTVSTADEAEIAQAVQSAYENRRPAKIGVGSGYTQFGVSRGGDYTIDAEAPYDALMNVIRIDDAQTDEPMGLIYSVPMHNTTYGNEHEDRWNQLSCELTGYASRAIEEDLKAENPDYDCVAMHINGFYGNSGPLINGTYHAEDVAQLQSAGEAFAAEIMSISNQIQPQKTIGDLSARMVVSAIPTRTDNDAFKEYWGDNEAMRSVYHVGAFGDIAYIGVNFEPFSIIGARLKAEAPYATVLPAANVHGWSGYIPTKETYSSQQEQLECSAQKTPFGADAEEIFYQQALAALLGLADVTLNRQSAVAGEVTTQSGAAVYTYTFAQPVTADKLVLGFGQEKRTDCAADFDLVAYNNQGIEVFRKSYENNSVNYIGEFTQGAEIASVSLVVYSRYGMGTQSLTSLQPTVHTISYETSSTTPDSTLVEKTDESVAFATDGAALRGNLPVTGTLANTQRLKLMLCVANGYWLPESYETGYTELTVNEGGENTQLLRFYTSCETYAPWGTDCIWLNIEPTEAGKAIAQHTQITGTLAVDVFGSQHFTDTMTTDVSFELTLLAKGVPVIETVNMALGGILDINLMVNANGADMSGCKVQVTVGDDTTGQVITDSTMEGDRYVYTAKLPAHRIPESLKIELLSGDTVVQTKTDWTVASYLKKTVENDVDNEPLAKLVDALNHYGAYAAYYNDPEGTQPGVDAAAAIGDVSRDNLLTYRLQLKKAVPGLNSTAALYLDEACDIVLKFDAAAWENYNLLVDGQTAKVESEEGKMVCKIAELLPQNWSKYYNIKVTDAQGELIMEYDYSVLSYAYSVLGKASELQTGLNDLMKAMYLYQKAAVEYINAG